MKRLRRHWYFIHVLYCPLCARSITERERRYGRRPTRWENRHEFIEDACMDHFL